MSSIKRILIVVSIAFLVSAVTYSGKAFGMDESNWPTRITLDKPFQIGDLSLTAGTYEFYRGPSFLTTDVVMVYSVDKGTWEGMVKGINVLKEDTPYGTGFTFVQMNNGGPERLEYWFYPNWERGIRITYPDSQPAAMMSASNIRTVK